MVDPAPAGEATRVRGEFGDDPQVGLASLDFEHRSGRSHERAREVAQLDACARFQLVVVDQHTLEKKDSQVFDTYGDRAASDSMRKFVEDEVNAGDYVMFGVRDEGSRYFKAGDLAAIGVPDDVDFAWPSKKRAPYAGIGRKGSAAQWSVGARGGTTTEVAQT